MCFPEPVLYIQMFSHSPCKAWRHHTPPGCLVCRVSAGHSYMHTVVSQHDLSLCRYISICNRNYWKRIDFCKVVCSRFSTTIKLFKSLSLSPVTLLHITEHVAHKNSSFIVHKPCASYTSMNKMCLPPCAFTLSHSMVSGDLMLSRKALNNLVVFTFPSLCCS